MNKKDLKILVAEDDETVFLYLEAILQNKYKEITIVHAKNGKEAIEFFRLNTDLRLVLMDLKLPVINGYNAIMQIRRINPDIPVIVQSAYADKTNRDKAFKFGAVDFISKPIDKDIFYKSIEKYLQ